MEVTVNTTNNENAKITLDEKALTSLIKDLAGSKPTTDFATDFATAINALNNLVQNKANECQNVVTLADLEAKVAVEEKPVQVTATTQPIAEADVPADIRAKAEEATTEAKEEYPTVEKDGADMEEIKKNIIMMELTKLKLQYGDSDSHKIVDMCVRYIENEYNMTKLLVNLTKICYTQKEVYRSTVKELSPLMQIDYKRFNEIFVIVSDVEFYC